MGKRSADGAAEAGRATQKKSKGRMKAIATASAAPTANRRSLAGQAGSPQVRWRGASEVQLPDLKRTSAASFFRPLTFLAEFAPDCKGQMFDSSTCMPTAATRVGLYGSNRPFCARGHLAQSYW
jgi:hypothetical protein